MRAQIRGLAQASENVQDASSLVQVAEGGMKEINDILQRIRELSVQASNDTLTNKDRVFVQEEIDEMKKSIGSIVHNTEFNTHKVLSNRKFDEFIKERRHASNTVEMMNTRNYSYVNISQNIERTNQLDYKSESVISSSISSVPNSSTSLAHLEKGTTVMDYQPRYSLDNDSIIFRSSRDGSAYVVPIDGSQEPQVNTSETTSAIRITSSDGLAKLDNQNTSLYLYTRDSTSDNWGSPIKSYSYNYYQDSTNGYTFSPNTDSDGNTSFVYSDTNGNVQKVNINTKTKQEISSVNLITNNDIENLPLNNNVINLRNTPDLYHMNTPQASLIVEKVTDLGVNELHYWDQSGDEPADRNEDGVYVNETTNKIELYGSWRPANDETVRVEYLTDYTKDAAYNRYVASGIDTYNLEDEDLFKERSLRVYVGGNEIEYSNTDGYTYDQNSGYISIHGIARPDKPSNQEVVVEYLRDQSGSNTSDTVYGIALDDYPEIYNLDGGNTSSVKVYRNGTDEIDHSDINGYQYNDATNTIELFETARPDVSDTYTVKFVEESATINNQDGVVEVKLSNIPEVYSDDNSTEPITFEVLVEGQAINYDDTKQNGYFYNQSNNTIEIYGDARPSAESSLSTSVGVNYVVEANASTIGNDSYDIPVIPAPLDYGVEEETEPRAMRVYYKGAEVPFHDTEGFTFNPSTNRISLHGSYRPTAADDARDIEIYSVTASTLKRTLPENHAVHEVRLNGQPIPLADDNDGNGYVINNNTVELVGDARPNINSLSSSVDLEVLHHESTDMILNNNGIALDILEQAESSETPILASEIDPSTISVSLNGNQVNPNKFSLRYNVLRFSDDINLVSGNNQFEVDFDLKHATGYKENDYTFQVGALSGQNYTIDIESFDNLLLDLSRVSVTSREKANRSIELSDELLRFVTNERSKMGSVQNRLEAMSNNLTVFEENTAASNSRIEDADIAKHVMEQAKYNILNQVQQSMLMHKRETDQNIVNILL